MSHHARIEEVSDSDPDDMDPSDFDPPFNQQSIISPANIPAPAAPSPVPAQAPTRPPQPPQQEQKREIPKHFQCLYPVYFDSSRSRAEGRKVGKEYAVENPLARDIVDAVQMAGLNVAFEPEKVHPKDWANPGRVRVHLRENGKLQNPKIKNSMDTFYYLNTLRVLLGHGSRIYRGKDRKRKVLHVLTVSSRTPSLHNSWQIPSRTPDDRRFTLPSEDPWPSYARKTNTRPPGS